MRHVYLALLVITGLVQTSLAQARMTADQVAAFIRSSIQLKHDDAQVAKYLKTVKLSDRLTDRRVEELQGQGAGPRTVAALRELATASAGLAAAPPPPPPPPKIEIPPPDSTEQANVMVEVTANVRNYTQNLPNYICVQVTRRRDDPSGTENWRLRDTIQEQLTYFDQMETYKVTMVNGQAVSNVDHSRLGGAVSSGEFGSILKEIFAAETQTEFGWDHWATLRKHRMYVFTFKVPQSRSHYTIYHEGVRRTITAGYHGTVYVDRDTKMVMRYTMTCDDIPLDFPVKDVRLDVNYDLTKIGDQEFVLPLKTEIRSRDGKYMSYNEAEFHLYRKFGTESTITFEPEALTDDKTKEEPAVPDAPKPGVK